MEITETMVEAAARVLAHRMEYSANKWEKYADDARWMLQAAADSQTSIVLHPASSLPVPRA